MSVTCRDKVNKGPLQLYISYLLKYSALKHRKIIKSLQKKSGVEILYITILCLYHEGSTLSL